ncbi:TSUP family transporter [bacterium]|nr:TSUP family transporter [bacterium]
MSTLAILCCVSFLSGLIDSIAGGGGLVQVPVLFLMLPHTAVPAILGTNKLVSFSGTAFATWRYARHVRVEWRATLPGTAVAFMFSVLGSWVVTQIRSDVLRPVVLVLLVLVAVYTFVNKGFGETHAPKLGRGHELLVSVLAGMVIGFYDGFFGPGTGSLLMFVFVSLFGFSFLSASASTKVVNATTNTAALITFALTGNIIYRLAVPMAACNVLGAFAGTHLAILKGSRFVRIVFLCVVSAIILKLVYDTEAAQAALVALRQIALHDVAD